jgi:hypothetical protein
MSANLSEHLFDISLKFFNQMKWPPSKPIVLSLARTSLLEFKISIGVRMKFYPLIFPAAFVFQFLGLGGLRIEQMVMHGSFGFFDIAVTNCPINQPVHLGGFF